MVQRNQNSTVTGGNSGSGLSHGDKLKIGAANYVADSIDELRKSNAFYTRRLGTKIDDLGVDIKKSARNLGLFGIAGAVVLATGIGYGGCAAIDRNTAAINTQTDVMGVYFPRIEDAINNNTSGVSVAIGGLENAIDRNKDAVTDTMDKNTESLVDTMNNLFSSSARSVGSLVSSIFPSKTQNSVSYTSKPISNWSNLGIPNNFDKELYVKCGEGSFSTYERTGNFQIALDQIFGNKDGRLSPSEAGTIYNQTKKDGFPNPAGLQKFSYTYNPVDMTLTANFELLKGENCKMPKKDGSSAVSRTPSVSYQAPVTPSSQASSWNRVGAGHNN